MRNLKKVLSLALAMVMLLGMMVVGAGATEFKDASDIKNTEAVAVVSGIGVLQGDENGSFNPEGTLSRAEAAVVIAKLDLGAAFGNLATTNASSFKDVGAGYGWAKPYIDYCAARGLIAGDGNGHFMPDQKVSGVQFALMVCRVLGYEDANEQIGGDDWAAEAAALARKAGLTVDVVLADPAAITRDDMAQVAFNALQADMVKYDGKGITIGDVTIPAGNAEAVEGTKTPAKDYRDGASDDNTKQLCEEKFPGLKLSSTEDNMGRPASKWAYNKETVSLTASDADYAGYITGSNNTLAKLVDSFSKKLKESGATVYLNGDDTAPWTEANGDYVEIYVDGDDANQIDKVVVTHYSVAKLTADPATRDAKDSDDVQVRVPGVSGLNTYNDANTTDTVHGYEGLAENDIVLYYTDGEGEFYLEKAESFDGVLTAYATTSKKLTISGTKYDESGATGSFSGITITGFYKEDSTWYTDKNGNPVWVEGKESTELAYVIKAGTSTPITGFGTTNYAMLLHMDGTAETVKTKDDNSASGTDLTGKFVKYTVKDDVYTLSAATNYAANTTEGATYGATANDIGIVKGNPTLKLNGSTTPGAAASVLSNGETIFLVRDWNASASPAAPKDSYTLYTGYANVPSMDTASGTGDADNLGASAKIAAYAGKNNYAKYVVVEADGAVSSNTTAKDMFYVVDATVVEHFNSDGSTGYSVSAIKNGGEEIIDLMFTSDPTGNVAKDKAYVINSYNSDGDVASFGSALSTGAEYIVSTGVGKANDTTFSLAGTAYRYTDETVVYYIDADNELTVQAVGDLEDSNINTFVAIRGADAAGKDGYYTIKAVFVKERSAARKALYETKTFTSADVTSETANTISLAGQTINVDTYDDANKIAGALNAISAISDDWTASVSSGKIRLTAKVGGVVGTSGPDAYPDGFTQATAGKEAVAATATIDVADAGAATATIGSHSLDLTQVANQTGTDAVNGYTWATTHDDGNSKYVVTVTRTGDNATSNGTVDSIAFTGGAAATAAVCDSDDTVTDLLANKTSTTTKYITIGADKIPVTGATLSDQLDDVVTYLNGTSALKTNWTATKSGSKIQLEAKNAGAIGGTGPAAGPGAGYTLVRAGVDAT